MEIFERTRLLLGEEAISKLSRSRVAVFGVGGVGGHVCEALIRSGIGTLDIIDSDTVSITNINRQIIATSKTVGRYKVDVMAERAKEINPDIKVNAYKVFYNEDTANTFDFKDYDYVVDAIDSVKSKILLIMNAKASNTPVISCMGAGNKMDPSKFEVSDIYKTSVCPLARVMRLELKKRGIKDLKVVYSKEVPIKPAASAETVEGKRQIPGSNAFVPAAAGLVIASEVVSDLTGFKK